MNRDNVMLALFKQSLVFISAKRLPSGHIVRSLNPQQQAAVQSIDGPMLVLAGAGSGKTSVITRKIAWLIEQCHYSPRHIMALTFTNKAAREMKERVGGLLSRTQTRGLTVSTFHTLGLNLLRREAEQVGLKPNFTLLDSYDCTALIKELLARDFAAAADQVQFLQNQISTWKNDLITPESALSHADHEETAFAARVYAQYERMLKAYNAVDFDDLIGLPTTLLQRDESVRARWQRQVKHLLVDEYQDTNVSQYQLVRLLVGAHPRFTIVGDDDQSIYSWRGARPENLLQLQTDFPALEVIKLEQNYRSTGRILKVANTLIDHNPHVFAKQLWSEQPYGEPIRVVRTPHGEAELERVVHEIITARLQYRLEFRDFAVLYRSNHQARLLELQLQQAQIPYRISGGTSFFEKTEIKDVMAYLRLLINPDDDAAFLRIINTPRREIGPSTLEKLGRYCQERNLSLYTGAGNTELTEVMTQSAADRLRAFVHWLDDKRMALQRQDDPMSVLHELMDEVAYESWLYQEVDNPKAVEKRLQNIEQLFTSLKKLLVEDDEAELAIEEGIRRLVLRDLLERQDQADELNAVQLMTLHAGKGLEFPRVIIIGLEEEILPHRNSIEQASLEEERRLFYVGITRAQRALMLIYAAQRHRFGETVECSPSRFLEELPPDELVWEGLAEPTVEQAEASRESALASLYAMFEQDDVQR